MYAWVCSCTCGKNNTFLTSHVLWFCCQLTTPSMDRSLTECVGPGRTLETPLTSSSEASRKSSSEMNVSAECKGDKVGISEERGRGGAARERETENRERQRQSQRD